MNLDNTPEKKGAIGSVARKVRGLVAGLFGRATGSVDLRGKLVLFDNDGLLLAWENGLRERRIAKEKEAWNSFEKEFGKDSPEVAEAFLKWQEQLYAYIERGKDRFLKEREGSREALDRLLRSGAKTIVVTKGARPYTLQCLNLLGLSSSITDIYSPALGKRDKRFADAVRDHGKNTSGACFGDTIIVGHDPEKDVPWDLVPSRDKTNDGDAPVFVLFDALEFDREANAPLGALPEIVALLARKGNNDFLRGFRAIGTPENAKTRNYSFKAAFYHVNGRHDKVKIPVIYDIKDRRRSSGARTRVISM